MGVSPPLWKQMVNWSDSSNSLLCLLPYWVNSPQIGCLVCPTQAADSSFLFFSARPPSHLSSVSGTLFESQSAPCLDPALFLAPLLWYSSVPGLLGGWPPSILAQGLPGDLPQDSGAKGRATWLPSPRLVPRAGSSWAASWSRAVAMEAQGLWPDTAEKRPSCLPWGKVFQLLALGLQWHGRDLAPMKEPREASHGPRGLPVASLWFGPLTAQLLGSRRTFPRANVPEGHLRGLNCFTVMWFILTWWTVHNRSAQF